MDETVAARERPATFNGPLEAGLRAVAILGAAHPRTLDLQRLVAFDYLLVHTGDIGGPASLHPPSPLHSAELLVRRELVQRFAFAPSVLPRSEPAGSRHRVWCGPQCPVRGVRGR